MILDTNAISALSYQDKALLGVLSSASRILIPFVCMAEYQFGINGSSKKQALQEFLNKVVEKWPVMYPSRTTCNVFADICTQLKADGRPIPSNDIWIAAIVRQEKLPLISRDQHFDQVAKLQRISW